MLQWDRANHSGSFALFFARDAQTDAILNGQRMQHSGRRTWKTVTTAP